MNKKGQALVIFIIFIPIFLLSLALIIDVGLMYKAKIKGTELLKEATRENIDIETYFKDNDLIIDDIQTDNCSKITIKVNSIFGNIIGIKSYQVKIDNC